MRENPKNMVSTFRKAALAVPFNSTFLMHDHHFMQAKRWWR